MFNVCPGCGEYSDDKEVIPVPPVAICPHCQYGSPFVLLPFFVVTGASGSGKTTSALKLCRKLKDVVVLDQDILWNESFNTPDNNYKEFRNTWLRIAKNINQAGRPVVLFGSAIPEQFENLNERRYIEKIHYLTLYCDEEVLKNRLIERPHWRKSGSEENLKNMVEFNNWLKENAEKTEPKMTLLDTTKIDIADTVEAIEKWVVEKLTKK
ncbi:MAG TPA: AAA family ATPase [Candidatus Melainabacteria bacterium]|nr:AAA family ATPase [Candidatus Melainabacteria bacterium]